MSKNIDLDAIERLAYQLESNTKCPVGYSIQRFLFWGQWKWKASLMIGGHIDIDHKLSGSSPRDIQYKLERKMMEYLCEFIGKR